MQPRNVETICLRLSPILKYPLIIMNSRSSFLRFAVLITVTSACLGARVMAQPKVSPEEQKAAQAIDAATDAAGKSKAAEDFIKRFPKSSLRPVYAQKISDQIHEMTDAQQKIAMAQQFNSIFNSPDEEELIMPELIWLFGCQAARQAFSTGATYLGQHPDSIGVLVELMNIATEQANRKRGSLSARASSTERHEMILGTRNPGT